MIADEASWQRLNWPESSGGVCGGFVGLLVGGSRGGGDSIYLR